MARDESPEARARDQRIERLVAIRRKLTAEEVRELDEVFPMIAEAHMKPVRETLRGRGLNADDVDDLRQECLLGLYDHIIDEGFPDSISALLRIIAVRRLIDFLRARKSSPESVGLPSSSGHAPISGPDVERTLGSRELAELLMARLPPEQERVLRAVDVNGLSPFEAAEMLVLPLGTVKSRLRSARHKLVELARELVPPSQWGTK